MGFSGFRQDVQAGGVVIRVLEIDVPGNEIVLHHEDGIDDFTCACHPHFVSRLALGGGDGHFVVPENLGDGSGFAAVADAGGGGVGIDIANIPWLYLPVLQA